MEKVNGQDFVNQQTKNNGRQQGYPRNYNNQNNRRDNSYVNNRGQSWWE